MIYTRVGKYIIDTVNKNNIKHLTQWIPETDDIFYHQRYDYLNHGITIEDSLDPAHWRHLSKFNNTKFVHENCIETFDSTIAEEIYNIIKKYNIKPSQFYFLLADENHCMFLEEELKKLSIVGCNFDYYNALLHRVKVPDNNINPTFKFSALSRNYNRWRLNLYLEFQRRSLFDNFIFSFHNIKPYNEINNIISKDDIRADMFGKETKSVNKWIKGIPYNLDTADDVKNKYSDYSYYAILKSQINILIETHFQPVTAKNYCAHITEKTYKNIVCKRPFIVFSTPGWLKDFHKLGYRTFSPFIDERYDDINDDHQRLLKIADEVQRIESLDSDQFLKLIQCCQETVEYNYNLFLEKQKSTRSSKFKFLN